MKLNFKPEDFVSPVAPLQHWRKEIADQANKRLAEMLKDATVVYGTCSKMLNPTQHKTALDTHKALLINIEPVVKECKNHEPDPIDSGDSKCIHCGVELVAEWKAKS